MINYKKSKPVKIEEGKVGIDPRSEILTNENRVYNNICEGTQVEVQGTRRMLKGKKKTATWY